MPSPLHLISSHSMQRLNGNADHALAALERAPERRRFGIIVVRPSQTKPGQAIAPSSSLRCPLYLFSITPKNGPPESEIAVFFLNSGQLPPSSIPLSPLGGRMKPSPSPCQFYRRREAISFGAAVQISSGCNQTSPNIRRRSHSSSAQFRPSPRQ